jgi:hypothetical protein
MADIEMRLSDAEIDAMCLKIFIQSIKGDYRYTPYDYEEIESYKNKCKDILILANKSNIKMKIYISYYEYPFRPYGGYFHFIIRDMNGNKLLSYYITKGDFSSDIYEYIFSFISKIEASSYRKNVINKKEQQSKIPIIDPELQRLFDSYKK